MKVEECFKSEAVITALNAFQTCSGYSLVYPAVDDLAHRRVDARAEAFTYLVRYAFNSHVDIPDVVAAIVDGDALAPAAGADLLAEVCYASFYDFLHTWAVSGDSTVINNCGSTLPTDEACFNTTVLTEAKDRFTACAGFDIDEFYPACTADELTTLAGSYDAYGIVISSAVANFNATETKWAALTKTIKAQIVESTGIDCAECYNELASDMVTNIIATVGQEPLLNNQPLINQYLASCADPTADSCLVVIGAAALSNFKECAGTDLNRAAFVPTEAPTVPIVVRLEMTSSFLCWLAFTCDIS